MSFYMAQASILCSFTTHVVCSFYWYYRAQIRPTATLPLCLIKAQMTQA